MYILILIFILVSILFNIFLVLFDNKLKKLEKQIIFLFEKRTNLVPTLYEITKEYLTKHNEVFDGIINLRKIEFSNYEEGFIEKINNEIQIHHELNFIFKVINKNPKIQNNGKYLLIKDLFLENSSQIGKKIELYKNIIKKINFLIILKNWTIIGIFINIKKRTEI
ncbi:MAG: LemA family protein [Candidatus Gracilibacteria bacterium]|nr:LemA family protein [Candidatus Gracilibacteria bacterium]